VRAAAAVLVALLLLGAPASASASSTQTVISTADSGAGSLRAAIAFANANPGTTIDFDVPDSGARTISPLTPLPALQQPTTIDGTSQPGYSSVPLIRLDGSAPGDADASALVLSTSDTVKGLELTGWSTAIAMPSTNGGNLIEASYIGTDGTKALPNGTGISINGPTEAGDPNTIGGSASTDDNVVSGNSGDGIVLSGSQVRGNLIEGNDIGTTNAFQALGNRGAGIRIDDGAEDNTVGGDPGPATLGNVIANNGSHGVVVDGATTAGNAIEANSIYDNAAPDIDLTNGGNASEPAPAITSVSLLGETISGTVGPGTHLIEVFANGACGYSGQELFVGSVTTSSTTWSLSGSDLLVGQGLVATSTSSASNTSEYSHCASVPGFNCGGIVATTLPATNITSSGATLNGRLVSPCLVAPEYFEYGTTTAYGHQGFDVEPGPSVTITGLAPDTTYHFRLVAGDELACRPTDDGVLCTTSYGADMTFTTAPVPPVLSLAASRAHVTRRFRAEIRVKCPVGAASPCRGTIMLTKHRRVLARARFVVQPGTRQTLTVGLDRLGRKLMRRHRRLRVQLSIRGASRSLLLVRG
jgi:hypothetical protein